MKPPTAGDVQVVRPGGVALVGRRWDPPPGTPVVGRLVVVHGLGDHGGRYGDLVAALRGAGWRVVAVDQRGHGRSPGRRGVLRDVATLVDDLVAVAALVRDRIEAPGHPVLYGHSMGGLVVLRTLQTRAEEGWRGAVLSAPWLATSLPVAAWKRALEPLLSRVAPDVTVPNGLRAEHLTRDPARAEEWRRDPLVHGRASAGLAAAVGRAQKAALAAPVPGGIPVLVLRPDDDPVTDGVVAARWARERGGPDVEVATLEGRRHEPHNDLDRAAVFARLLAWLDGLRGG